MFMSHADVILERQRDVRSPERVSDGRLSSVDGQLGSH